MNKATLEFGHQVAQDFEDAVFKRFPWLGYTAELYEEAWHDDRSIVIDHKLPFYFVDKCNEDSFSLSTQNTSYPIIVESDCRYSAACARYFVDTPKQWEGFIYLFLPWYDELVKLDERIRKLYH